jgi:hypothetical protein
MSEAQTAQAPSSKDYDYQYQVDQQVSINAFFDAPIDNELVRFQVTSRYGSSPEKIVKTTEAAIEAYKELRAAHPLPEKVAAPAPVAPAAAPAKQTVTTPAPTGTQTLLIKKMKVEPQPDGKVKLALFSEGHKYADLFMSMGLDATLKALDGTGQAWEAKHLSVAAEFDVSFYADWKNSDKLNTRGNPYKNVIALHPDPNEPPF